MAITIALCMVMVIPAVGLGYLLSLLLEFAEYRADAFPAIMAAIWGSWAALSSRVVANGRTRTVLIVTGNLLMAFALVSILGTL